MHKQFMRAALEQAWLGRGKCAPNPSVGAVVVCNEKIVARASHQGSGLPHAEYMVLQNFPQNLQHAVLYVTLEPCNHWGKTPPCIDVIINSGVTKVVYAYSDPNPVVAMNNTPRLLQEKGIEVVHFAMAEIDAFYQSYKRWIMKKKPTVTVKMAQSLDGKIAGPDGQRVQLSNADCFEFTHQQRRFADVLLTTAQTIVNDNPNLDVRLKGCRQVKPIAILDRCLSLSPQAKVLKTAMHCHIYYDEQLKVKDSLENCSYHAISSRNGKLDLAAIFNHLGSIGYHDVWVEAGGKLFSAIHQEGLVNRTFLYIVPKVLGEMATQGYYGDLMLKRKHQISWQIKTDNIILGIDWLEDKCLLD